MSPEMTTLAASIALLGIILALAQTRLVKPFVAPVVLYITHKIAVATSAANEPTVDDVLNLTGLLLGIALAAAFGFNAFATLHLFPETATWVLIAGTGLIVGGGGDGVALLLKLGGSAVQAASVRFEAAAITARQRIEAARVELAVLHN